MTLRLDLLLVDDDQFVRDVLARLLERRFSVWCAASAEEALEIIVEHPHFDVILSDVMMPGLGAEGLLPRLPAQLQERVIFMTGGLAFDGVRQFLDRAQRPVLIKPLSAIEMFQTIDDLIGAEAPSVPVHAKTRAAAG
ncbi:MAG: response regulator [Myxococcota bacterium]